MILQATAQWWLVGWGLSILMLLIGFGIAVTYYKTDSHTRGDTA